MKIKMKSMHIKTKALFLLVLGIAFTVQMEGQNSCDNLYAKAVKYQQTMTIDSQNQAITYFQKAQACYDSEDKKNLCSSQITTCKNTISMIKSKKSDTTKKTKKGDSKDNLTEIRTPEKTKMDTVKARLSVSETIVKFKAKGGEFKKVKVTCNLNDWTVTDHPDWISYSINKENEIVLEAAENPLKEERSGMIKIECRGVSTNFAVLQSKKSLLGSIGL